MKYRLLVLATLIALLLSVELDPASLRSDKPVREAECIVEQQKTDVALLRQAESIGECRITYYCTEDYPHICGTGTGLTASGAPVVAGVSCAVDPSVIPLGSTVLLDYGDGDLHQYLAQDTGGAVIGNRIDIAVPTHNEALQMGVKTATVYVIGG